MCAALPGHGRFACLFGGGACELEVTHKHLQVIPGPALELDASVLSFLGHQDDAEGPGHDAPDEWEAIQARPEEKKGTEAGHSGGRGSPPLPATSAALAAFGSTLHCSSVRKHSHLVAGPDLTSMLSNFVERVGLPQAGPH
jgi:hypothetical protein